MNHSRASTLKAGVTSGHTGIVELDRLQEQIDRLRLRLVGAEDPSSIASELEPNEAVALVREILRARRRRDAAFAPDLFGEPSWDLLLELYAAEVFQERVSISSACIASAVPPTTALRWIGKLEKDGWVRRESDPLDGRRYWLALTQRAATAMHNYLRQVALRPVVPVR